MPACLAFHRTQVGNSYRRALADTVEHYSGWRPEGDKVDALKSEGIWNNDWQVCRRHASEAL